MKKNYLLLLLISTILWACDNQSEQPQTSSIIGRLIDKASNEPLTGSTLILENNNNSYLSSTDINGYFEFKDVTYGDYTLISRTSATSLATKSTTLDDEITDTIGIFSTLTTNWGEIYSQVFCSITGKISLPNTSDYSEVVVKLLGTDKTALTTNKGFFRFDFLFPGFYDLKFEKESYRDLSILDLNITKGVELKMDTALVPIYKLVKIEKDVLKWDSRPVVDFAFCNDKFWYCLGGKGLYSYDPVTKIENVELWENLGMDGPYGLSSVAAITNTYNNSFWLCGDAAIPQTLKLITLNPTNVEVSRNPIGSLIGYGWDNVTKCLVSGSYRGNTIHIINTKDQSIQKVEVDLDLPFEKTEYKNSNVTCVFIMPNQEVYLTIEKIDHLERSKIFIYKYNNIHELTLIDVYKFPDSFEMEWYKMFSYYKGEMFIKGDRITFE